MFKNGVLEAIGNTPTVKLSRIINERDIKLYAKLEFLNPGGSIKDRTAYKIITSAMQEGIIDRNTTIIESSSGNMAIGIAQICNYLCLKFICVVDLKTNNQTINILKAYGAEVEIIKEAIEGDYLQPRINRVKFLKRNIKNSFWCNQYANMNNVYAHYQTMKEIIESIGSQIDFLFVAVSTCGTLRGCSEFIKKKHYPIRLVAVDAKGSVIFSNEKCKRLIPGHGAARRPELMINGLNDFVVHVTDMECINGCRKLLKEESILAGGSSGGVISALLKMKRDIPEGSSCVVIFPDRGERYLDTIFSDDWVRKHFYCEDGDIRV